MIHQFTRGKHAAPRTRGFLARRPKCGLIPELPALDAVPSMELQDGHMQQRPYDTLVPEVVTVPGAAIGLWRPAPQSLAVGDTVRVNAFGELYHNEVGPIEKFSMRPDRPFGVRIRTISALAEGAETGIAWFAAHELEFVERALGDTLVMDEVHDDVVLMGGAAR